MLDIDEKVAKEWTLTQWKNYKKVLIHFGIRSAEEITIIDYEDFPGGIVYPDAWCRLKGIGYLVTKD